MPRCGASGGILRAMSIREDLPTPQASNWGKWGESDEVGTLNYIDAAAMRRGFASVTAGRQLSLSMPIRSRNVPVWPDRAPAMHFMTVDGGDYAVGARAYGGLQMSDDYLFLACHGGTHIDALCHVFVDDLMYNGHPSSTIRSSGARLCGIDKMPAVITRGILLDVAQHRGRDHLDVGYAITARDLNECAQAQGVSVTPGDAVLVRTGHLSELYRGVDARLGEPGLGSDTASWCDDHKVSVIGADNHGVEVKPSETAGANSPMHIEFLRNLGLPMIELLDLSELSRERIYEFLFVAVPLKIAGGAGSPLNPIAVV